MPQSLGDVKRELRDRLEELRPLVEEYRQRDPIQVLERRMREAGLLDDPGFKALNDEVLAAVDDAVRFAEDSPDPAPEELWTDVYAPETA